MWQVLPMMVTAPDGRVLEVVDSKGPGLPVVYHGGTPTGPVSDDAAIAAAREAGLRWITYGRPGYGASTPAPGRTVADAAADTAVVLDALGLGDFVTYGVSGGGPHALACGALLPGRCRAVASVAGVAPYDAQGLDFLAGMGEENVVEFTQALAGRAVVEPGVMTWAAEMRSVTGAGVADSLGGLVPDVDRAALSGVAAEHVAATFRKAVEIGHHGWLDDDLAFTQPWGFFLAEVAVPVSIWQGAQDLMVPFSHGQWLAAQVPGASSHLFDEHGHLSITISLLPRILSELAAAVT